MDDTKADVRTGAVLNGRYRVVELLGEGGMGLVYRGERLQLGRPVAIKFLHSPFARSAKFVGRFEREARAMSRLSHPHCVSVIDFGLHDAPYIVMDFVTGSTLREVLDREALSVTRALSVARQMLLGLAHAHEEGIVHRDVKPGNVMLATVTGMEDQVRIFDFGLAKLHDSDGEQDTTTASVVGTPAYMAPEQASAGPVDARADVYAAGIVLFEMLAGHKPFQGEDAFTVLCMQRDTQPPRLAELKPGLSPALCALVEKALAKDPVQRFQSAVEFIAAIDALPELRIASLPEPSPFAGPDPADLPTLPPRKMGSEPPADPGRAEPRAPRSSAQHDAPKAGDALRWRRPVQVLVVILGLSAAALGIRAALPASDVIESARPAEVATGPSLSAAGTVQRASRAGATEPEPSPVAIVPDDFYAPSEGAQADLAVDETEPALPSDAEHVEPAPATAPIPVSVEPSEAAEQPSRNDGFGAELTEDQLAAAEQALDGVPEPPLAPAASGRLPSLAQARALGRVGRFDEALSALRELRRRQPKSPALAMAIGDLHFARGYWTDALAKYRETIRLDGRYRQRVGLQRNAIRALDDTRTYGPARTLLVKDIGRAAVRQLQKVAKSGSSKTLRARAAAVLSALR
ncbi:MAG: serine/threonine protein kinase [Pseudomonadota bacterium]|jgi:serine/threonine-protein kinase